MQNFLFGLLLGCSLAAVVSAQVKPNERETINVGADLSLGMAEDPAIKLLVESGYSPTKVETPKELQAKGVTSLWFVQEKKVQRGNSGLVGSVTFSSGKLDSANKVLEVPDGDEVAFGRQLYFALRDLESEGDSHCVIETKAGEVPDFAEKMAKLRCGKKTIIIELQKLRKQAESVQLNEELDATPF